MTAVAKLKEMRESKKYQPNEADWRLVDCLGDLERNFSVGLLRDVTELFEEGYEVEDIAEATKRDPDEIFVALFHQGRHGKTKRSFGVRLQKGE